MNKNLCAFVTLGIAACVNAQADDWQPLSEPGGYIAELKAESGGNGRVLARGLSGLYRSEDHGRSWRQVSRGLNAAAPGWPQALANFIPFPSRWYLFDGDGRLLRSEDGAASFTHTGLTLPYAMTSYSMAVTVSGVVFTASHYDPLVAGVYYSTDGGATMARAQGLPAGTQFSFVQANPLSSELVAAAQFVTDAPLLYRSSDNGANWSPLFTLPGPNVGVSGLEFLSAAEILVSLGGTIFHTTDGGTNWAQRPAIGHALLVRPLPGTPEVISVGYGGCTRSVDMFATAQPCNDGLQLPGNGETGLTVSREGVAGYRVLTLAQRSGVVALEQGAQAWQPSNAGLYAETARGLALTRDHADWILAGQPRLGNPEAPLLATTSGGAPWMTLLAWQASAVRSVSFDPTTTASMAGAHIYTGGYTASLPWRNSGLYKSVDGGSSWTALDSGLPVNTGGTPGVRLSLARGVRLDPRSCANPPAQGACVSGPLNTLFALTNGSGSEEGYRVIRSTEGGANWVAVGADLPVALYADGRFQGVYPTDIEFDAGGGEIYVSLYTSFDAEDGQPFAPTIQSGVFRSSDGGLHWTAQNQGLPLLAGSATTVQDIFALAVHPRRAGTLWAATSERTLPSGIHISHDRGANWTRIATLADCSVRDLQVDRRAPDLLYAAGVALNDTDSCALRSEDGGVNWTRIPGELPANVLLNLQPHPRDSRRLIAAGNRGVWQVMAPADAIFTDTEQ